MSKRNEYLLDLAYRHTETLAFCELRVADWITGVDIKYSLTDSGFTVQMTVSGADESYTATGHSVAPEGIDMEIVKALATADALMNVFVARWEQGMAPVSIHDDESEEAMKHMEMVEDAPTLEAALRIIDKHHKLTSQGTKEA